MKEEYSISDYIGLGFFTFLILFLVLCFLFLLYETHVYVMIGFLMILPVLYILGRIAALILDTMERYRNK